MKTDHSNKRDSTLEKKEIGDQATNITGVSLESTSLNCPPPVAVFTPRNSAGKIESSLRKALCIPAMVKKPRKKASKCQSTF